MENINQPALETDVQTFIPAIEASTVPAEFARKLERELDEAREKLHRVLKLLDDYDEAINNPSSPFLAAFKKLFTWKAAK